MTVADDMLIAITGHRLVPTIDASSHHTFDATQACHAATSTGKASCWPMSVTGLCRGCRHQSLLRTGGDTDRWWSTGTDTFVGSQALLQPTMLRVLGQRTSTRRGDQPWRLIRGYEAQPYYRRHPLAITADAVTSVAAGEYAYAPRRIA